MTLAEIKRQVTVGQVYDVTNHYITRVDHPCYGTTRRVVAKVTGSSVYLSLHSDALQVMPGPYPTFAWPKACQVEMRPGGVIQLYGGGAGQKPTDLYLTLTPVKVTAFAS